MLLVFKKEQDRLGAAGSINQGNQLADSGLVILVAAIFLAEPELFAARFDVEKYEKEHCKEE